MLCPGAFFSVEVARVVISSIDQYMKTYLRAFEQKQGQPIDNTRQDFQHLSRDDRSSSGADPVQVQLRVHVSIYCRVDVLVPTIRVQSSSCALKTKKKTLRTRASKPGPSATIAINSAGDARGGPSAEQEQAKLKALIDGYKGFGILSIIRVLMFRDCRSCMLALVGLLLLVGQWTGPVGFIAFKLETEDMAVCEG